MSLFRKRALRPCGTYTDWWWPGKGYSRLEHELRPEVDPGPRTTYFWSHQFRTEAGEGGYLGLQTWGNRVDGSLGKMAIFSFWNTLGAEGPGVTRFGGEGEGWSCRIPFYWDAGTSYRLAVEVVDEDPKTIVWAASVDGEQFGRILAPAKWGRLGGWSVMWTEYYGGPLAQCSDLPYSNVVFGRPTADGSVRPARSNDHYGDGDCRTSLVSPLDGGDVRHEMGRPQYPAK